jgi:hypothetical protein
VVADRWFPSSKTCSCCGSVKAELDLSQRMFRCGPCGLVADRDCSACEKSCTTGRKLCGVSLWRGTLWRGSQELRQTRLKEAGTERRGSALRSLSLPSRRFRRAVSSCRVESALPPRLRGGGPGWESAKCGDWPPPATLFERRRMDQFAFDPSCAMSHPPSRSSSSGRSGRAL